MAGLLVAALMPATPAAAVTERVDNRFFGVHDSTLSSLSNGTAGSLRLWDAGVTWRDIETAPGVFDFTRLDAIVRAANARNVEVTLVFGMTPSFYASDPTQMPASLSVWNRYVSTVVNRYRPANWGGIRGIAAYQVWNEANVRNFWTGTPMQLAQLTKAAYKTINRVDTDAIVVGPSMGTRIAEQIRGIRWFYYTKLNRRPVWKFMDVVSLHLYPLDRYGAKIGTPETSMTLLKRAKREMRLRGVPLTGSKAKPIWNTEVNYGAPTGAAGGTGALPISDEMQAAYVIRTYLLNAAAGIERVHWYSYYMGRLANGRTIANTLLSDPADSNRLTLAGRSVGLVRAWLRGRLVGSTAAALPCAKDRNGTYTCVVEYNKGVRRIYWNPTKRVKIQTVKSATYMTGVFGVRKSIRGGSKKYVGSSPVMVRSAR